VGIGVGDREHVMQMMALMFRRCFEWCTSCSIVMLLDGSSEALAVVDVTHLGIIKAAVGVDGSLYEANG
jgi:hypothetical protein